MKSMTVLKISPLCRPEVISIPHTLEDMQTLVGGAIQAVYPYEDPVAIVCNEDGIFKILCNFFASFRVARKYNVFTHISGLAIYMILKLFHTIGLLDLNYIKKKKNYQYYIDKKMKSSKMYIYIIM